MAAELGCASAVVTFDRHPAMVVRPDSAPEAADRPRPEAGAAGQHRPRLHPGRPLRQGPLGGVRRGVRDRGAGGLHGRPGRGGRPRLPFRPPAARATWPCCSAWAPSYGFDVHGLRLFPTPRAASRCRRPASASCWPRATWKGRPPCSAGRHEVRGVVHRGDARGRDARVSDRQRRRPRRDLPARRRHLRRLVRTPRRHRPPDRDLPRPATHLLQTADPSLLEAHLLDFDGDLYDERARVHFVARLRGQQRFDSVGRPGRAQMGRDVRRPARPWPGDRVP